MVSRGQSGQRTPDDLPRSLRLRAFSDPTESVAQAFRFEGARLRPDAQSLPSTGRDTQGEPEPSHPMAQRQL